MKRHRHQESVEFLSAVEQRVKAGKIIQAILDNYGTQKHPKVEQWLANYPRWVYHFTPTSASWPNAVKNIFSAIMRRSMRDVFQSAVELEDAISVTSPITTGAPNPSPGPKPPMKFSKSSPPLTCAF